MPNHITNRIEIKGDEANGMDTSYLRAALERSVCSQHYNNEPDEELYEKDDFEEYDDFQMTF